MDHSALKKELNSLFSYGLITIASYLFLFSLVIILTEFTGLTPDISYALALTLTYLLLFFTSSAHVFKATPSVIAFSRFVSIATLFWVLNNLGYLFFYRILDFNYIIAAGINILTFGPVRYVLYRNWVFVDKNSNKSY